MNIEDVVDLKKFKYVQNVHGRVLKTRYGDLPLIYAFMSDGASNVIDFVLDAFEGHDQLVKLPYVYEDIKDGVGHTRRERIRLTHVQCDMIYGDLFAEADLPFYRTVGWIRSRFLMIYNSLPFSAWAKYRRQEKAMGWQAWEAYVMQTFVVPHAEHWAFPSMRLKKAVWIGPQG